MTNEEIYRSVSVQHREKEQGKSTRFEKFIQLVGLRSFDNDLIEAARKDERQRIAQEVYAQQAEIIKIDGLRTIVVEVHKLQAILPEEQLPF